jgi:amino acid transporter
LISALNVYSVDWTIRVQNFFTVAKLAAIAVLVGCGIYQLSNGESELFHYFQIKNKNKICYQSQEKPNI